MVTLTKKKFYKGFKIIGFYLKPYKKILIQLSFIAILSAIAHAAVPYLIGRLVDSIISRNLTQIGSYFFYEAFIFLAIWIIFNLLAAFLDWINEKQSSVIAAKVEIDFIIKFTNHLLRLPLAFHKKYKIGSIWNKMHQTRNALFTITDNIVIYLTPRLLSIIAAFILAFSINLRLSFILLGAVIIYVLAVFKIIEPAAKIQKKVHKYWNQAFGNRYDAVLNIREVKQAAAEKREEKKIFIEFKNRALPSWIKQVFIWRDLNFSQQILIVLTQLLIFIFSIIFIFQGQITVGELLMFNGYAAMVFGPFVILGRNWQQIQNGFLAIEETDEILKLPEEIYSPASEVVLKEIKGDIEFKNVSYYYEKNKPILENISFKIKAGEILALVGRSGVGKTTLIDLLSAYSFPKKGKILIDGVETKRLNLSFLRSNIAVVPQEPILFNETIEDNIKYGKSRTTIEELRGVALKSHALEFIEKFPKKWQQLVGERGIKLSAGQKQRIALARAILRNPKILILDEPTSALDAHSEKHIQDSLKELMKGRTTLVIAHRLSTVRQADKIVVLKEGQIVEIGKHEELIKKEGGEYKYLYELQIGLHD